MVNCDDVGNIWMIRLSENEVAAMITDGNCYSNNMTSLSKGRPTKVSLIRLHLIYILCNVYHYGCGVFILLYTTLPEL